jgi:predicted RNase H-like HicB family nuclease
MREYTVILHPAEEGGYWVEVPALPGCLSQGETDAEALAHIREAIESHLAALRQDGQEIPTEPKLVIKKVEVAFAGGPGHLRSEPRRLTPSASVRAHVLSLPSACCPLPLLPGAADPPACLTTVFDPVVPCPGEPNFLTQRTQRPPSLPGQTTRLRDYRTARLDSTVCGPCPPLHSGRRAWSVVCGQWSAGQAPRETEAFRLRRAWSCA